MWCFGKWGIITLVGGLENVSVDGKSTWVWGVAEKGVRGPGKRGQSTIKGVTASKKVVCTRKGV